VKKLSRLIIFNFLSEHNRQRILYFYSTEPTRTSWTTTTWAPPLGEVGGVHSTIRKMFKRVAEQVGSPSSKCRSPRPRPKSKPRPRRRSPPKKRGTRLHPRGPR